MEKQENAQEQKEWVTEVNVLGIVENPNLMNLIGYCVEPTLLMMMNDERGFDVTGF